MAQTEPAHHSPTATPKRPKGMYRCGYWRYRTGFDRLSGILKNSISHQHTSPEARLSPILTQPSPTALHDSPDARPGLPSRELSEREITQLNTEINAGAGHRRNSSNPRGSLSRRQSGQSPHADGIVEDGEHGMRLKWDEANLWLNEGQMGGKMKIDEPKTPFAKQYDPAEDEEEISTLNAQELAVDELDMEKSKAHASGSSKKKLKEDEIPGLDLGEPEMDPKQRRLSDGDRRVTVDKHAEDDGLSHGEDDEERMSREEKEKHRKFEAMRKKHYEMKNIKNLLG